MSSGPDFLTRKTTEDVEVLTTFDPRVQRAAEAALAAVFDTKIKAGSNAQAAVVVMSPDGAVRAMIGGRDFGAGEGQFNRATQARRQTGSLFKPFVFAAALQAGASPYDRGARRAADALHPRLGRVDAAELHPRVPRRDHPDRGAGATRSTPPRCGSPRRPGASGCGRWRRTSASTGPIAEGPALALGVSEATLLEMTGAYAGILNRGVRRRALRADARCAASPTARR